MVGAAVVVDAEEVAGVEGIGPQDPVDHRLLFQSVAGLVGAAEVVAVAVVVDAEAVTDFAEAAGVAGVVGKEEVRS